MGAAVSRDRRDSLSGAVVAARKESLRNRRPARRVRQEVRDGLCVVLFSAAASTVAAVLLTILAMALG
jgi:hypothetical protein